MFEPRQFDALTKKLFAALPASLHNLENEIQQKFKEVLQTAFARLDLVTREEFDVQSKVLARTREKLETLQAQLDRFVKAKDSLPK